MKKFNFVLLLYFLLLSTSSYAQLVGFSSGISYYGDLITDFHYQPFRGPGYKLSLEIPIFSETSGRNFTHKINWDEYPEQFTYDGYQYTTLNIGLGKYFEEVYVLGIIGISKETYFRNYYDPCGFLGRDGEYFQKQHAGYYLNYGAEGGIIIDYMLMGIMWTNYSGWGATFGYVFYF